MGNFHQILTIQIQTQLSPADTFDARKKTIVPPPLTAKVAISPYSYGDNVNVWY